MSRDVLSSLGLRPSGMCENRGESVLVCLFCHFLNIERMVRIGCIFSGVNVFNYKLVVPGRLAQSLVAYPLFACPTCFWKCNLKNRQWNWYKCSVSFVSGFTLRSFEFSIAVAVVDRPWVGPETNVYSGIARACTCERTTITMIYGRPCVMGAASVIYLFISPL